MSVSFINSQVATIVSLYVEHTINTRDHRPVRQRPRQIPLAKIKEAEEAIQNMVKQEVIEQSMSPWNSNPVLVRKSDGSLRFR
jgi:hypothetical protein